MPLRASFALIFIACSAAIPLLTPEWGMKASEAGLIQSAWHLGYLLSLFTEDYDIILNTVYVAVMATVMAVLFGFTIAWILTRTNIAAREKLERLMEVPYYMTPLVGALAWAVLASPKNGFLNQIWHSVGGKGDLFDIYTLFGIAWVMALFEGTVAYVMISASMKSMDPALEEAAQMSGAGPVRTLSSYPESVRARR